MSDFATSPKHIETDVLYLPYKMALKLCGADVHITRLTHLKKAKTPWKIGNHAHLSWEFHYVLSGSGTVFTSTEKLHVKAHQLYITPPLFLHSQVSDTDCLEEICIECSISPDLSENIIENHYEIMNFLNSGKSISAISYSMPKYIDDTNRLLNERYRENNVSPCFLEGVLFFLISQYINTGTSITTHKHTLQTVHDHANQAVAIKNFIDANVCKDITTQDIANEMFISTRQIDRIFSKQYHMSSFQYLQSVRTKVAVNMIEGTDLSFQSIASTVGFSSYRQMLRSLYNSGYLSPTEIRRQSVLNK